MLRLWWLLQSSDHLSREQDMPTALHAHPIKATASALLALGLAACGGGGSDAGTTPTIDTAQRTQAATTTATNNSACVAIKPFYWEIGDRASLLASASVNSTGSLLTYDASTVMNIASASKWLYGAYVVERRGVAGPSASDIKFLNFRSGYTSFTSCSPAQTVGSCVAASTNGVYTVATDGKYLYDGGHMQKHASLMGLDALDNGTLATEMESQLGSDVDIAYSQPQLAGGVRTSAANYARYLRKLLGGQLRMGAALGTNSVCTNPATCSGALGTPVPLNESWSYSLGHWVETDPAVGDGAFSSAGAFGFYPWVDAAKRYYGIVARQDLQSGSGFDSAFCGRLIRKAWLTGMAQ
jgi:hypothetical protein